MLRRLLLYLSRAGWARSIITHWGIARRVARRFVAGETLDEAVAATRALNARKLTATLDYLGESVHHAEDTQEVVQTYRAMLQRIHQDGLQATVSLKLTHLGLDISEELCLTNLRLILGDAKQHSIGVTIDMESTAYTDATLRIYRTMRDEYDFTNVGTVIQAYLRRTEDDMRELGAEGSHVRLCKGAYLEPPELAFPAKADVDANYVKVTRQYLQTPGFLCIATHDENMIQAAESAIRETGAKRFEFQMLYGIRSARQDSLAAEGETMRVYVPYGTDWYGYFMRRLAERPANVAFFLRSLVGTR
ncbi:MAG: proline dehydrogenase family protein [Anaerolineae bacterium]|nr:proline dehydrogenase family protein [Anaerolineae bacterium]